MRYYNENPQVTVYREGIEKAVRTIRELKKEVYEQSVLTHDWEIKFHKLRREVIQFDSLPWYKKMFFKFKL